MGTLLTVRAWCHAVAHAAGGTARPLDDCRRKALEFEVNRYLRPLGVAASLEAGSGGGVARLVVRRGGAFAARSA